MDEVIRRYDAVVFDFDGVLIESVDVKARAFADLYRPYGADVVKEVVAYHLNHCGVSRFAKFRYFHESLIGEILTDRKERELADRFAGLVEEAVVSAPYVTGALEFLEAEHAHLPLSVASATPNDELLRIVKRRGMEIFFRHVAGSPATKDEILRDVVALTRCEPKRVLMVGDALTDYEGARQAGVSFVGRVPPGGRNPFPSDVGVVDDISCLQACLYA